MSGGRKINFGWASELLSGTSALEDRILVLQDRLDVLAKAFNPSQLRAPEWIVGVAAVSKERSFSGKFREVPQAMRKAVGEDFVELYAGLVLPADSATLDKVFDPNQPRNEDGEWTEAGGGSKPSTKPKSVIEHVRDAKGWVTTTRIGQAVNKVAGNAGPLAKEALSHAVATAMTYHSKSGPDYDAVQVSVMALADRMEISAREARDHVVSVLQRLKVMRNKEIGKAAKDPVIDLLDKAIDMLKGMEFNDTKPNNLSKLEDRILVLQDKVDTLRKDRLSNKQK